MKKALKIGLIAFNIIGFASGNWIFTLFITLIILAIVGIIKIAQGTKTELDRRYELKKYQAETERMRAEAETKKDL